MWICVKVELHGFLQITHGLAQTVFVQFAAARTGTLRAHVHPISAPTGENSMPSQPTPFATAHKPIRAQPRPGPRVHVVMIDQLEFASLPEFVEDGDVIEWVNLDDVRHTITSRDGRFDVNIGPGQHTRTIAKKGTLHFYCKLFPSMSGQLIVL